MRRMPPTHSFFSIMIAMTAFTLTAFALPPRSKAMANALEPGGRLWAVYSANYSISSITAFANVYDLSNDSLLATTFLSPTGGVNGNGNARGIAFDPTDGNLWYSTLLPGSVATQHPNGDGLIHKKSALGGADIASIPEPGGIGGPGIGSLDFDPEDNALWAAAYWPVNGRAVFYKLNPNNGNVLKTISLPSQSSTCCGNTTLAVARPADLNGAKVLLTTAGFAPAGSFSSLYALDVETGAIVKTYSSILSSIVYGIDVDDVTGDLIVLSNEVVRNLGPAPYSSFIGDLVIENRTPTYIWSDISLDNATPVIFIPGIAGSALKTANNTELWPGLFHDHNRLTLDPGQPRETVFAKDAVRYGINIGTRHLLPVYAPLLNMLAAPVSQGGGGLKEYALGANPSQCDLSQKLNRPTLFVFPYDWRKSNAENATALKDYVDCVRQLHSPNSKVNILAHSMGGILARRYILDNPTSHNVNKLITIATPWLGAPKAGYSLETGDLGFGLLVGKATGKELLKFFPGAHELLPSQSYFNLGGRPFEERGLDINGNRQKFETYNSYSQYVTMLDRRFPFFTSVFPMRTPGTTNSLFHSRTGQDDWRNDQTGVQYYHFFGQLPYRTTIGKVIAAPETKCDATGQNCVNVERFKTERTFGDDTAPALSAERRANNIDLNAPNSIVLPFRYSHLGLTQNAEVQTAILAALKTSKQFPISSSAQSASQQPLEVGVPAYYFTVNGVDDVTVRDCCGNNNEFLEDTVFRGDVPGVGFEATGDKSFEITMPASVDLAIVDFTITFRSGAEPIFAELIKGDGKDAPSQAVRYRDLNLPAGVMVQLKITEDGGIGDLRYDADGDGEFETIIPPTASLDGQPALDVAPPTISVSGTYQQNAALVAITATDSASGVKSLRYSLDGHSYQPYTGPFTVNFAQSHSVYAYADDFAANRRAENVLELRPVFSPAIQYAGASGGSGGLELIVPSGFNWTAHSNDDWIILTSAESGGGEDIISFETRENFTGRARAGALTIAGAACTVIQDGGLGADCPYSITPASSSFTNGGGSGTISISTEERCAWQVISNASWIKIISGNAGIANGTAAYTVEPNTSGSARAGTITVAGKTFPIKQK